MRIKKKNDIRSQWPAYETAIYSVPNITWTWRYISKPTEWWQEVNLKWITLLLIYLQHIVAFDRKKNHIKLDPFFSLKVYLSFLVCPLNHKDKLHTIDEAPQQSSCCCILLQSDVILLNILQHRFFAYQQHTTHNSPT